MCSCSSRSARPTPATRAESSRPRRTGSRQRRRPRGSRSSSAANPGVALPLDRVPDAQRELETVRAELAQRPPEERVFAYEDPKRPTPWEVPPGAGSLADCFITAHGDNLLEVIAETLEDALEAEAEVQIRPFAKEGTYTYFVTARS